MNYLKQSLGRELPHPTTVNVLVVDDVRSERMRLAAMIGRYGYNILEASDGNEAYDIIAAGRVEIVISDWQMPASGGIELCQRVVSSDRNPPYFIMLTGRNSLEDLIEGMDAGADDFLCKPVEARELRVRLQAGLRVLQLRRELGQRACEIQLATLRVRELEAQVAALKAAQPEISNG